MLLCISGYSFGQKGIIGKDIYKAVEDSLLKELELLEGKDQFPVLLELVNATRREEPDLGASYLERAKPWINESVINRDLVRYKVSQSAVLLSQLKYEEVKTIGEEVLAIKDNVAQAEDVFALYQVLGTAYSYFGEQEKAQEAFLIGLHLADSLDYELDKSGLYNSIGMVHQSMKDSSQTEKNYLKAMALAEKNNQTETLTIVKGNLAIFYTNRKRYTLAEEMIRAVIKENVLAGERSLEGTNYNNLGVVCFYQERYAEGLKHLRKALEIAIELKQPSLEAVRYTNVGEAYLELGLFTKAEEYIINGLERSKALNNAPYYENSLKTASGLFERMGKHKQALQYYKSYSAVNDSLINEKRVQAVAELQEKYESEKREREILSLSNQNVEAERKVKTLNFTVLGMALGLFGLGFLLYFLRQNNLKNTIIQNKNLQIASDKISLLERDNEINQLESLVKGQESERERLAKELHDGLGGLLAISHSTLSNLENAEGKTNGVVSQARKLVGDAYHQVRQISHNLMPLDLEKFGLVPTLQSMIELVNNQNDIAIDFHTYHFESQLRDEMGLNIYRVVQEAISNILKYAKAENVLIELIQHEGMISLTIEDDGEGFDLKENAAGIGLKNMRNRIERLKGNFEIESSRGSGTSISIQIPHQQIDEGALKQAQT